MMEKETILDKLMKVLNIAGNAILMNLLFLLASLPIITMGQAWCGLLTAVRYNIRGDKWFNGFKDGFKTRFLRGTIAWIIMLAIDLFFMLDMFSQIENIGFDIPSVMACIVFALMIMVTFALQILNVYVPTKIGQWMRNAVNMVFKAPAQLLVSSVLFWVPIATLRAWDGVFVYMIMIFLTIYFVLAAVVGTLVLKNTLFYYLLDARATGTLLGEEGNVQQQKDDSQEQEEG